MLVTVAFQAILSAYVCAFWLYRHLDTIATWLVLLAIGNMAVVVVIRNRLSLQALRALLVLSVAITFAAVVETPVATTVERARIVAALEPLELDAYDLSQTILRFAHSRHAQLHRNNLDGPAHHQPSRDDDHHDTSTSQAWRLLLDRPGPDVATYASLGRDLAGPDMADDAYRTLVLFLNIKIGSPMGQEDSTHKTGTGMGTGNDESPETWSRFFSWSSLSSENNKNRKNKGKKGAGAVRDSGGNDDETWRNRLLPSLTLDQIDKAYWTLMERNGRGAETRIRGAETSVALGSQAAVILKRLVLMRKEQEQRSR